MRKGGTLFFATSIGKVCMDSESLKSQQIEPEKGMRKGDGGARE